MPRRLLTIEIAEGALLADIAVIFQLIWVYLPPLGMLFRPLIPVVFTILVLRRRLYSGFISLCVAVFLAALITGPNLLGLIYLLLEGIGGLFLGWAMKRRMSDPPILLLGITGAALGVSAATLGLMLLWLSSAQIVIQLRHSFALGTSIGAFIATLIGLSGWWTGSLVPILPRLEQMVLSYWWAFVLVANWLTFLPVVPVIYFYTNLLARLLGYDVRPFPGGRTGRLLNRAGRAFVAFGRKRGWIARRRAMV